MTNREIATILLNIAELLEQARGNPYRIQAYRRTAHELLLLPVEARDLLAEGKALPIPGLGERMRNRIAQLITGGRMPFYEQMIAEQHPTIRRLMRIPGIGPKTAMRLYTELQINSPEALLFAARRGRIRILPGFGVRSEQVLAEAAARVVSRHQPPLEPTPGGHQLPLPGASTAMEVAA